MKTLLLIALVNIFMFANGVDESSKLSSNQQQLTIESINNEQLNNNNKQSYTIEAIEMTLLKHPMELYNKVIVTDEEINEN